MSTIQNGVNAYASSGVNHAYQTTRKDTATGTSKTARNTARGETQKAEAAVYEKNANSACTSGYDKSGRATGLHNVGKEAAANRPGAISSSPDYGKVVGEPKLSEAGASYLKELKSKYGNMDFVLVSKDMIGTAKNQAASYGNPNRMVVLIDEEKIERMAADEKFRQKYEAIISQAQSKTPQLRAAVFQNPNIKSIGINVLDNGAGSFMAACAKNTTSANKSLEEKRAAKKAEKKAAEKKAEKKKVEKKAEEKQRDEKLEAKREERAKEFQDKNVIRVDDFDEYLNNDDYEIIYADSMDDLISKLEAYNQKTGWSAETNTGARYTDFKA